MYSPPHITWILNEKSEHFINIIQYTFLVENISTFSAIYAFVTALLIKHSNSPRFNIILDIHRASAFLLGTYFCLKKKQNE